MMVESVYVKNFKLLDDLAIEGLRPVTLLGGDNGCGKNDIAGGPVVLPASAAVGVSGDYRPARPQASRG